MKKLRLLFSLLLVAILMYSCTKEESERIKTDQSTTIETRSGKQGYITHTPTQSSYIQSIKTRVDQHQHFDFGSDFEDIVGRPDWTMAAIPQKNVEPYKSVIVPIIKADEINAFFHIFDGTELTYNYVNKSLIRPPYFVYVGPANHVFEQIFDFYDHVLTDTPFEDGTGYDDTFDGDPELGGCYITTSEEIACSCHGHVMGESCVCEVQYGGNNPYVEYTTTYIEDCEDEGGGGVTPSNDTNPGFGSGSNGGNNNNNNTNPKIHAAYKAAWSVCPIIPQVACAKLEFIIEHSSDSDYCLSISAQVADLLEDPSVGNIAAATCYIMNTDVQQDPSAPNSCTNPFSSEPLSDFAAMYNEINISLISWAATYSGLDNIPCDLTVAGYTSDEKNQILQALKDYLGNPPPIGIDDPNTPNNPEMDIVNALNLLFTNNFVPSLIPHISWILQNPTYISYFSELADTDQLDIVINIFSGLDLQHFDISSLKTLLDKSIELKDKIEWNNGNYPRAELIDQIDAIQLFLEKRHLQYGEAAKYFKDLLPYLISVEEFNTPELYRVYELAYIIYEECIYNTLAAVIIELIKAIQPFIEFALIETGFSFAFEVYTVSAQAGYRLTSVIPQTVKNVSALVWNRVVAVGANRLNTLIPETFKITASSGQKFYTQYSGTKHMAEMVLKENAINYGWYASQKSLRSQLVLDDFAKALDDIVLKNPNIVADGSHIYKSGKWEVIFQQPIATSEGLISIKHAAPIF